MLRSPRPARLSITLAAALTLWVAPPRAAEACSVTRTFLPPSNYELVRSAGEVVLARATGEAAGGVTFEIVEALRGSALRPKDIITLEGGAGRYMGPGPIDDFSRARPGASAGGCIAYDYRIGGQFLLLLRGSGPTWSTLSTPFARVNEEVTAPGDPWLAAVRHYVRIAALADPRRERAALEGLAASIEKSPSQAAPRALGADIERHLQTPSAMKSFAELKAMFDAAPPDARRARILLAISLRGDPAAGAFMANVLQQAEADPSKSLHLLEALAQHYERLPDPAALTSLADLYIKLGSAAKSARWPLMLTLIRRAGPPHRASMQKAIEGADDEEAGRLSAWFARYPSPEATAHLLTLVRGDFEGKSEITLALAAMGAKPPLEWALRVRRTPSPPQRTSNSTSFKVGDKIDMRWLSPYVIARSPLPEADRAAGEIIRERRQDFVSLLQGYEDAAHPNATKRLKEIAALPHLSPIEQGWLERTTRARSSTP